MDWIVFSYSLPAAARSSPRVAVWRRLRALGSVSPKGGVHVLPARDECVEALQWLAHEVEQAKGDALLMRVERFEGLSDAQLIALFQQARAEDYAELDARGARLAQSLASRRPQRPEDRSSARDALEKLRRGLAEIARIDFFSSPERARVAARLDRIAQTLSSDRPLATPVPSADVSAFRNRRWVTRPHPHVDRLACAWLIRRFINPHAMIRYANKPAPGEVAFDMRAGQFGHRGNLCTFETMLNAFGLRGGGLRPIAEIVHEIDLRDGQYARPEAAGVDAVLTGWRALSDPEKEAHGIALFEGLYTALSRDAQRTPSTKRR